YQALVRIPLGTVLWEETAFRGVLQAALGRVMPAGTAIAVTSCIFGIWHIGPTAAALRINGLAGGPGKTVAGVTAGVAATAAGGVLLSWLRTRAGSLAAPMLLHAATNSMGALMAWAITRRPAGGGGNEGLMSTDVGLWAVRAGPGVIEKDTVTRRRPCRTAF